MKKTYPIFLLLALALCSCANNGGSATFDSAQGDEQSESIDDALRHTVRFFLDGEAVKTLSVKDGSKMETPSSKEFPGYIIHYWYVKEDGAEAPWTSSEGVVTSNLDLYANFQYETYVVKLIPVDGNDTYETSVSYKQAYDFSEYYRSDIIASLSHLEGADGKGFGVSGTWLTTHDETLTPIFDESSVTYRFYELSSAIKDGRADVYSNEMEGVDNPNPASVSGKPANLNASLKDASKGGYRFEGWYRLAKPGSVGTNGIFTCGLSKLESLYAGYFGTEICGIFSKSHSVSVSSADETKGTAVFDGENVGSAYVGDTITVKASPVGGCVFKGWYEGKKFVSEANPYTFAMPTRDYSLKAVFLTEAEKAEELRREALGIDPAVDSANQALTYGLYPQTHVSDETMIESLNALTSAESNGWYLLNNKYYAKKKANPHDSGYAFDDGTKIVEGTTYWFKCEPIVWKILSSSDGEYSLVSTMLLDVHCYNAYWSEKDADGYYCNNYAQSEIRSWLNDDFYKSAFSFGNSLIQTTIVDNSASTTDSGSNEYICEDTDDKVYLLSYQDYRNDACFAGEGARQCKTTDWARASGAWCNADSSYNGYYWTRSPSSCNSYSVSFAFIGGYLTSDGVDAAYNSARPAITIKFER